MKFEKLVDQGFVNALTLLNNAKNLPMLMSYHVSKIAQVAQAEQKEFFRLRKEAIARHALKNEDGTQKTKTNGAGQLVVDFGDNQAALEQEFKELQEQNVDLPYKIKLSELLKLEFLMVEDQSGKREKISLSGGELNDLAPILEDDMGPKPAKVLKMAEKAPAPAEEAKSEDAQG